MRNRLWIGLAGLYALAAVITFGHAAAQAQVRYDREYLECAADQKASCFRDRIAGMDGFFAALGWPLYWSWEAWS